jgi:hypothetical protein
MCHEGENPLMDRSLTIELNFILAQQHVMQNAVANLVLNNQHKVVGILSTKERAVRTKWLQTPCPRIAPSGWRRGDAPSWDSVEEDGLGLGLKAAGAAKVFEGMHERQRRVGGAGGGGRNLAGGWCRTRGRGRVGAGSPGGGAGGRRRCPGTACRSSRSSTCPAASLLAACFLPPVWVLSRSLPSLPYFKRTFRLQASLQSGISQEFCDFSHDLSLLNSLFQNSQSNLFIVI